jgi:hypothetical protein
MLHPLIVPNRVRHKSGSVDRVQPPKVDDNAFVVRRTATWFAEHGNEKLRLPVVSTACASGASAADAIIIDSDEDIDGVSSLSRTDMPREPPINHGTSLNQDVVDYSDSDIELLSVVHSGNKVEGDPEASYHSPLPPVRELSLAHVSDIIPSDPPPSCALPREEDAVSSSGHRSDGTDMSVSDFEADGADEEVNGADDIDGSRISPRHAKPPSLPSLQPVRKLLARGKRRGGSGRDIQPERTIIAPRVSQKQGGKEFPEEAPAITSSESEEELDCPASDPQLKRVLLPKTEHGRARRLLMPESADLPLVAVTMRGDCHFIERKKK